MSSGKGPLAREPETSNGTFTVGFCVKGYDGFSFVRKIEVIWGEPLVKLYNSLEIALNISTRDTTSGVSALK